MTATAGFVEPAALIRWACAHPTGSPAALQETLTVRPETGSSHFHDLPAAPTASHTVGYRIPRRRSSAQSGRIRQRQ
jgi:hypothetical protein